MIRHYRNLPSSVIKCEAEHHKECLNLQSIRRIVNLLENNFNRLFQKMKARVNRVLNLNAKKTKT